jgi:cytidylate kinase
MKMKVVTIDGPAASGKSSVSREVAKTFGWKWVSTGAFYRGLAYVAQRSGTNLKSEEDLSRLANSDEWGVELALDRTKVYFQKEDVTDSIYLEDVGTAASQLSLYPKVRASLLAAQRACSRPDQWLVAEGRDCGTVVFPEAAVKIYLTAESEARAQRRATEEGRSFAETQAAQAKRDQQDSTRKTAPLQIPESAHVVDTSHMDLDEVVQVVLELIDSNKG